MEAASFGVDSAIAPNTALVAKTSRDCDWICPGKLRQARITRNKLSGVRSGNSSKKKAVCFPGGRCALSYPVERIAFFFGDKYAFH